MFRFNSIDNGPFSGLVEYMEGFLEADFNGDGDVDGDDFLLWQGGFNQFPGGDATKMDGATPTRATVSSESGDDFLVWQTQFGSGTGASEPAVPEPSSITLLLAVVAVLAVSTTSISNRRNAA